MLQTPHHVPIAVPSPKAGDDSRKLWRHNVELQRRLDTLLGEAGAGRGVAGRKRFTWVELHPFKIYQLPYWLRATPGASDWRKFRIRAGWCLGANATGTDGHDTDPDAAEIAEADMADITVPDETAAFWFWIADADTAPVVKSEATATKPTEWTATLIPIGFVDTDTYSAENRAVIRQLLRTDVISTGGGAQAVCPAG